MSGALPAPLSSFVGRDAEASELAALIGVTRLVSVTGLSGSGKTRLALEVAKRLASDFPGGLRWVSVGGAVDVAEALGRAVRSSERILVVCDGAEQAADALAEALERLLATNPEMRVLVTSRRRLGIAGELAWTTPPMAPADDAVRLFVDRARNVLPRFDPTAAEATTIARICRRLADLPLAIELAAARIRLLSIEQIATRLDDMLGLLSGGGRAAAQRHHSLRAALDATVEPLGDAEHRMLAALSVLADSFDLDAVEALGADSGRPLDVLAELVERSLVAVIRSGPRVRYRLPEPVRQYARGLAVTPGGPHVPNLPLVAAAGVREELRIRALGEACVHRGSTLIEASAWAYAKPRELLYFLLSRASSTKEQIGAALWPSTPPASLRNSFHTTLHHLRRALGDPEWIVYRQGRYAFNPGGRSYNYDVQVLEAGLSRAESHDPDSVVYLRAAAEVYQGDFLTDLAGEQWIDERRTELRGAYERVLLALGRRYLDAGQYAEAVQTYTRAIAHDNLLEAARRGLIYCYAQMGERARALDHYNNLVTLLRDQLGIEPSRETSALYAALRDGIAVLPPPTTFPPASEAAQRPAVTGNSHSPRPHSRIGTGHRSAQPVLSP